MAMKKKKRKIEVFIAGCQVCFDAVDLFDRLACPDDAVTIGETLHSSVGFSS